MRTLLASLVLLAAGHVANASAVAGIHSCDGLDSIGNLVESYKEYAQGAIRVAHVSTEEPAAASDHLLIFVAGDPMSFDCFAVSRTEDGRGFNNFELKTLKSSYDAKKGLLLELPVQVYGEDGLPTSGGIVKIRINRTGSTPNSPVPATVTLED